MADIVKSNQQTQFEQKIVPFGMRGLVLKLDQALLSDGQFSELSNCQSVVEGQLTQRFGCRRISSDSSWDTGPENLVYSISKLHASSTRDYYYAGTVGFGGSIFRADGPIPQIGASLALERVAVSTSTNDPASPYEVMRWSAGRYNAGAIGTPYIFFACPQKMLKDDGTLDSGDGSGDGLTKLQRWGIVPPTYPATATVDALTILPATEVVTGSGRINTTISTFQGTGPGLIVIVPVSMAGIIDGMLLRINSTQIGIVEVASQGSFSIYLSTTPANGQAITSGQATAVPGAVPGTVTQYTVTVSGAEFNGLPQDGYDTDDIVHVAIGIADPANVADIRIRVMVNSATGGDYYEKEILPSQVQDQASVTDTAITTLPSVSQNVDTGVLGPYNISDNTATRAKPVLLSQVPASNSVSNPIWTELDIPKNQFLKVGLAGTGNYTWKNIKGFQVVSVGTAANIWIGSIYIAGGFGPNAVSNVANVPLLPYSYLYTFRNPITGWESNPSPAMIPNNYVTPLRQAVKLVMVSSTDNQVSAMPTVNTATTNKSAIAIYRAGGAFGDNLYRLVGYATNSVNSGGGPDLVTFTDHQSDASLISAPTISFDNDPPVRSTLPIPFVASWASYSIGTGVPGYTRLTVSVISSPNNSDLTAFLTKGSVITIAPNTSKQEICAVVQVGTNYIDTIFQYDHTDAAAGPVFVTCDSVVGKAGNLCLSAFDSMFVAGDSNNPHVLYKSKTGRPEAFPVVELDTGIANQINVGSPSNPIMNLAEYNGQILSMNLDCLYVVQVFLGQMQTPQRTAATRGLYASWAWCRVDNEIWYLAYDGVYSWSGGQSVKRSEAIDPLFHGISIGPYAAIDLTASSSTADPVFTNAPESPKDFITLHYSKQRVYVTYRDINFQFHRLRYDLLYDRWSVENIGDAQTGLVIPTAVFTQEETGFVYDHIRDFVTQSDVILATCIINSSHSPTAAPYLYMDDVGSSDGWVNSPSDGAPIQYSFQPAAYTLGAPSFQKQYSDCITELNNDAGIVQIQTYYNFSPVPDSRDFFTITIPSTAEGRKRSIFSFQNGYGKEAYSLQFRFSGSTTGNVTFYTVTFNYFSLDQLQIGRAFDWDDLGTPDDKRLYEVTIWYDAKQHPHTWVLDTITGIVNNQTVTEDVQEFILEPLQGSFTGPSWTQVTFPINDNILTSESITNSIVKKVRLRPKNPGGGGVVCVDDTTQLGGVAGQYGNQRWGIFNVGGVYYRTLYEGISTNQLFVLKSSDSGVTWVDVTGSKTINGGDAPANGISVAFDGTFIYVLYAATGSANPRAMTVSKFDTGDDGWEADITGLPTLDTTTTTSGLGPGNLYIAVKPNGKLEILYNGSRQTIAGVTFARAYLSEYNGSSWSAGAAITGQTGVAKDFLASQIIVGSTNRAHFFLQTAYTAASGWDLYHVSIPEAGVQQTFQLLASDVSTKVYDTPSPIGLGLNYIDAMSVERLVIPYIGGGSMTDGSPDFGPAKGNKILRGLDVNNPTWTVETVDTSTQVAGFQLAFEVILSVAYDVSSDTLYVLWVSPTAYGSNPAGTEIITVSGAVLYSANSGTGWSAPVQFESFAAPTVPSGVLGTFFSAGVLSLLIYKINSTTFYY